MIAYETHQRIVSDALIELLRGEFACEVVLAPSFDPSRLTKGEYIRFWFMPSELDTLVHSGEYRNYTIEIHYYFDIHRKRFENVMDNLTARADQLKQLLIDHISHNPGNYYKWHYLATNNIDIMSAAEIEDIENAEDIMEISAEIQITRGNF